jgi:sarcosine oxidase
MSSTFDAIVIGVGAMGSSACFHLAKRGIRVLGLEQFRNAHDQGSSHGQSRMIRTAYYEHPDYVPLLKRAWILWRELEAKSKWPLLYQTGGLYLGPPQGKLIAGSVAASQRHWLKYDVLDASALKEACPQFRLPEDWVGIVEHKAGFLVPERATRVHGILACVEGATIHDRERVVNWHADASGVTVTTEKATYAAKELIFCAGAWTDRLMNDLQVPLIVTRQVVGHVQPTRPESFALGKLPVWATDNGDGTIYYGFPIVPGQRDMKLAHHAPGEKTDPDTINREAQAGDEQTFLPALRHFGADAQGPVTSMQICMYTNSPDHHFIVDRSPAHPHVTLACGFSGHGFKFASVIGEVLADLAIDGRSKLPIEFLGLNRFSPRS